MYLEKDGTIFLIYGRIDFEEMTGEKFSYVSGLNGHYEITLSVEYYAKVDETFQEFTAAGARPLMLPTTEPWGQRTCYVVDPEGNLIEIGSFEKGNEI